MKKICVVTATRAEYGVLRPLIEEIRKEAYFELCLVVTGTHLSERFGYTVEEIEQDGVPIAERIPILEENCDCVGICRTMGTAGALFGEMYKRQQPDIVVVVGDRYELLPICSSAMIFGIPIAHISGGELTEGAMDDSIRHAVTKMSYLHFPGCEEYRKRIIQLGEAPERVFNYGDIGVENIRRMEYLTREELEKSLCISLKRPFASVTFHPVTLEKNSAEKQVQELIEALRNCGDINFIVTMSNADMEGDRVNELLMEASGKYGNIFCYTSLGSRRYLSLMKYAMFVIGNSSSGIIEAPCFGIPSINIGSRQNGRLRAGSVIDCEPYAASIVGAIEKARSAEFRTYAKRVRNPYGDGETSVKIVRKLKELFETEKIGIKKHFYDI